MPEHSLAHGYGGSGTVGQVNYQANGFDPTTMLSEWDYRQVSILPSGQTLREYHIAVVDKEIKIALEVFFPAWTYNQRVLGPSLRCVEGDRIRNKFVNAGSHPHTIRFHGIHAACMDGIPGVGAGEIRPGSETFYEFDAYPFGCHLLLGLGLMLAIFTSRNPLALFPANRPPIEQLSFERIRVTQAGFLLGLGIMYLTAFLVKF